MAVSVFVFAKKDYVSKKTGTVPIYLGILENGENRSPIPLKKKVNPKNWIDHDAEGNRLEVPYASKYFPGAGQINTAILEALGKGRKIIERYQANEWVLTYDRFKKEWGGARADNLETHVEDYLKRLEGVYSEESIQKIRWIMGKFTKRHPNIDVQDVDYKMIKEHEQYMLKDPETGGRGNSEVTVYANLKEFRNVMKDAFKQDFIRRNPFDSIRLSKPKVEKIPLELEDVLRFEQLLDHDLPYYLRKTLCWWLLAIYTGRRYGDLENFYEWDIRTEYIQLVQDKRIKGQGTRKVIMIFINERIQRVIDIIKKEKYEPLSNSMANKFLKELASLVGIGRKLHFHLARHTFNHINKRLQSDLSTRKDLLGHDSTKSTQAYERPVLEHLQQAMLRWNNI
jgi:integrase/recombinase XerD